MRAGRHALWLGYSAYSGGFSFEYRLHNTHTHTHKPLFHFVRCHMPGWLGINFLYKKVKLRWSLSHAARRALVSEMLEVAYLLLRRISCSVPEDWPV